MFLCKKSTFIKFSWKSWKKWYPEAFCRRKIEETRAYLDFWMKELQIDSEQRPYEMKYGRLVKDGEGRGKDCPDSWPLPWSAFMSGLLLSSQNWRHWSRWIILKGSLVWAVVLFELFTIKKLANKRTKRRNIVSNKHKTRAQLHVVLQETLKERTFRDDRIYYLL